MLDEKVRAMLGDKAAQDRFTKRQELLPCPCCGEEPKMKVQEVEYGLSLICFTYLASKFGEWWMVLFALLFFMKPT